MEDVYLERGKNSKLKDLYRERRKQKEERVGKLTKKEEIADNEERQVRRFVIRKQKKRQES